MNTKRRGRPPKARDEDEHEANAPLPLELREYLERMENAETFRRDFEKLNSDDY